MVAIGPNFFYTVTLPVTLWFLDRGKRGTPREDTVLFLDARHIFRQIDRAHREFLPEQIEFLANIVRLYRGEELETVAGSESSTARPSTSPTPTYADVPGLCKVATLAEIEAQGWSLNPGRYVGVAADRGGRRRLRTQARRTVRRVHRALRRCRGAAAESRCGGAGDFRVLTEWREMPIAAMATTVAGGPFGSSLGRKDYLDDGVPVIRGAQLSSGTPFCLDEAVFSPKRRRIGTSATWRIRAM